MTNLEQQLDTANRLSEITQRIGYALWQIQELEGVSATYYVLVEKATFGMGVVAGNELEEEAKKKTFGVTIHKIVKAGLLSAEIESRITSLLMERNWLVHSSRADSRNAIHSDNEMRKVLTRLNKIADEALYLLKHIGSLTEKYAKDHGVTSSYIDEKSKEILKQWHSTDAI
jgi:hypothetical protein